MLGDTNVGKTSLVLRFAEGYYRENSRSPTVGAFFITKRVQTDSGITCKVQIWDTAGQTQFRKMAPMYYKTAAAAVLCYDVYNLNSFQCVKDWLEELSPMIQGEMCRLMIFMFIFHVQFVFL
jgi:small GTP-binding protein